MHEALVSTPAHTNKTKMKIAYQGCARDHPCLWDIHFELQGVNVRVGMWGPGRGEGIWWKGGSRKTQTARGLSKGSLGVPRTLTTLNLKCYSKKKKKLKEKRRKVEKAFFSDCPDQYRFPEAPRAPREATEGSRCSGSHAPQGGWRRFCHLDVL